MRCRAFCARRPPLRRFGRAQRRVRTVAYTASKSAVAALTHALAQETVDEQIWVNAVAPSILDTPANRAAMPDANFSRWVAPADIAELIVFLASPANRVTRGAVIPVYGGS